MLEKDKYASRFIQSFIDVYFHGNKWCQNLNIFLKKILKGEKYLQSLPLSSLTVGKTSTLFSYFIQLVEFFPWNQSFKDQKVTDFSLILKDISLVFYLKFFHSLLPPLTSRRLKQKARKEIFDFGNIGQFQFRQLFLMSLFFFSPGEVSVSNLFLELCCLECLQDKLNYLIIGQVKKEDYL